MPFLNVNGGMKKENFNDNDNSRPVFNNYTFNSPEEPMVFENRLFQQDSMNVIPQPCFRLIEVNANTMPNTVQLDSFPVQPKATDVSLEPES